MSDRGTYRGLFSAIFDDPDYQALTPDARLVLLTVRLCLQAGPGAIFRYYPAVIASQTGLALEDVDKALRELAQADWVVRDDTILWVRNGLRYDPSVRLGDPKHRKAVEKALAALPKRAIVLMFCDHYEITRPFDGPTKALRRPIEEVDGSGSPRPRPRPNPESEIPPIAPPGGRDNGVEPSAFASRVKTKTAPRGPHLAGRRRRPAEEPGPGFDEFWRLYPKKRARKDAISAWNELNPDALLQQRIAADVRTRTHSHDWTKDDGQFIPYPASYVRGRRWEDEAPLASQNDHGSAASLDGATRYPYFSRCRTCGELHEEGSTCPTATATRRES